MIQTELTSGKLTNEFIITSINQHSRVRFKRNLEYAEGKNPAILSRVFKDASAPHNKIPVSYARKIINTVSGYMYKPGLITYNSKTQTAYMKTLVEVFYANHEELKTAAIGKQASVQGVGFELHYTDGQAPRFTKIPADELIPVYDYAAEPNLIAAIRHYTRGEDWNVEVYYAAEIDYFHMSKQLAATVKSAELVFEQTLPHLYGQVPVAVFENNEELVGDFEPVIPLIDAYDVLVSDSLNEFDRFAQAYLILKGLSLKKEDAKDLKQNRIFNNLPSDADVKFLSKDIPSGYIEFMAALVRKEIHKQSHVPDFTETATGQFTGAALDRLLYDFELVAATKEALFKKGLYKRLELLNTILVKRSGQAVELRDIEITMHRNKPTSLIELGDAMTKYAGIVSDKTLIANFAPFVKDIDAELKQRDEENAAKMPALEEPEEDMPEDNGPDDPRA